MRTFRDFMESALYDPSRGFYPTRTPRADFYTAPELHPAFGAVLADRLAVLLRRARAARPGEPLSLVEAGCGNGTLAAQVARRLRDNHPDVAAGLRFVLVERSRRDLTTAARALATCGLCADVRAGIDSVPPFVGALYTNEMLDALPAHLLQKNGESAREVFVGADGATSLGEPSTPELAAAAASIAPVLAEGERHAVCLEAPRWLAAAARALTAGFLVTVDYGKRFSAAAANPPRAYRAHRLAPELTASPGAQDLTVPVDFSALIAAGHAAGASLDAYQSLTSFLLEGGIASWLAGGDAAYAQRARLKTLVHPEGMGEAFKVLIQRKGL